MKTKFQNFRVAFILILTALSFTTLAETWLQVNSGTSKKLNTIFFSSAAIGYIGGNDSLLLKTTDGGLTWTKLNYSGVNFFTNGEHILNLQFLNDTVGFMTVGPYSGSYGTTNGGLTWTQISLPSNQCFNRGLFFFDEFHGFIGGSACFIGEMISAVSNNIWTSGAWAPATMNFSTSSANNYITDIDFYSNNFGLAASKSGYIYRTVDAGLTWDSVPSSVEMNPITSVLIVNDSIAYAGYEAVNIGFGLYISTNGGLSWSQDMNSATFYYPDFLTLHQTGSGKIYTGGISQGNQGVIFHNPASSAIWGYDAVGQQINDISSYMDSIVFAVGDSGYIVVNKTLNGLGNPYLSVISTNFDIFPNPAKNEIHIKSQNELAKKDGKIKIYSALGKLLIVQPLGSFLDVSQLAAGIYFVEIAAQNNVFRKKIILE